MVEDIVLLEDELKHNDPDCPNIGLVVLVAVPQQRLDRHIALCSDLVPTDVVQSFCQFLMQIQFQIVFLPSRFAHCRSILILYPFVVVRIELSQPKIDDNSFFELGVVEEVARFDISMENTLFL